MRVKSSRHSCVASSWNVLTTCRIIAHPADLRQPQGILAASMCALGLRTRGHGYHDHDSAIVATSPNRLFFVRAPPSQHLESMSAVRTIEVAMRPGPRTREREVE